MRKRLLAVFLAVALVMGLSLIPSHAKETPQTDQTETLSGTSGGDIKV